MNNQVSAFLEIGKLSLELLLILYVKDDYLRI